MILDKQGQPVDFIYVKTNKSFEKMIGLKGAAGKKATELTPKITESNSELFEIFSQVSLTGESKRIETYIKPLLSWFSISAFSPKKGFFVIILEDITSRKKTEKNLENEKAAARNVLEDLSTEKTKVEIAKAKEEAILLSIGNGLIATNETGKVILINKIAEKLLDKKSREVVGENFSEVAPMEDEKGVPIRTEEHPINKALSADKIITVATISHDYYCVRKNKTRFPVAIIATPVILGRKVIGAIGVFQDVTKEREVDRLKSEFISLASHQLKTPPTIIKLLAERLLGNKIGELTKGQREYIGDISLANQRMIDLVNALLDMSRIELGAFELRTTKKDVCEVIRSIIDESRSIIDQKHLRLRIAPLGKKVELMLDETLFRTIINSLITNAITYTPAGGEIEVTCRMVDKGQKIGGNDIVETSFVVIISDTGYGIPQSQQDKVFNRFFRADNAREKNANGTGLGLYIVKSVLDRSNGLIWFSSRENKGSMFYVAIPLTGMRAKAGSQEFVDG
jgi:signal transduction histidine kinase